jgi:DNA invertase Pin-like site-specific DNA recombinase
MNRKENPMKKAGAIIRVSTTRQLDGTSPEKQIERILGLADAQGYDIDQKHIWQLAESGGSRERVGFAEALKAGTRGEISRIYVFNIDRLGRDFRDAFETTEDLGIDRWKKRTTAELDDITDRRRCSIQGASRDPADNKDGLLQ